LSASVDQEVTSACVRLAVRGRADAIVFATVVRDMVRKHGGTRRAAAEAAIAAAEMVQNIVAHAACKGDACVWFEGDVLVVRASDTGPGMTDPAALLRGREARCAGGLPAGLGLGEGGAALVRLMDRVTVRPNGGSGLVVTARKHISRGSCVVS
jgi:anti-sigma regulatory factor (Ser/Thr protein kinase)